MSGLTIELSVAALVGIVVGGSVAWIGVRRIRRGVPNQRAPQGGTPDRAEIAPRARLDAEAELRARRQVIARAEEELLRERESLKQRILDLERRERLFVARQGDLETQATELRNARDEQVALLEKIGGLTAAEARREVVEEAEKGTRREQGAAIRRVVDETKRKADSRAAKILAVAAQRIAPTYVRESTVSHVDLPSDEMKGRIIGREGRNIHALERVTGVDVIIDDTPCTVTVSSFDPIRRAVAKATLERLICDGRIQPAKIEETHHAVEADFEREVSDAGENAAIEARVEGLDPELTKALGRLHYRTSYGQNVLAHSLESSRLAAMIAEELGVSSRLARRAALLHDIGKAASQEIEGPHALVGAKLARRYGEEEAVAHAIEAHHGDVEPRSVEAVLVQIADSLSGGRPGARGEMLQEYVKRMRDLEKTAMRRPGVENAYAVEAGRDLRVIVKPDSVDDETTVLLAKEIARDIERECDYPGEIRVTVIREHRAIEHAR